MRASSSTSTARFFHSTVCRNGAASPCLHRDDPSPSPSSNGVPLLCFSLLETLIRRGLLTSARSLLLQLVRQSSSADHVVAAADLFLRRGIRLHLSTYALIFRRFLQLGHPNLVHSMYNERFLPTPVNPENTSILNSLVISFCRSGQLDYALTHFNTLLSFSPSSHPCKTACNLVIRGLCSTGRELDSFLFFTKIRVFGNSFLDSVSNKVLIRGLSLKGYLDEALQVFDEMPYHRDAQMYMNLVWGLCGRGFVMEAEALCSAMESDGLSPERVVYTWLINGYCRTGKMKMAMRVFFGMLKRGRNPDEYTYNTVIHGFFHMGMADMGWVLYNMMLEGGILPTNVTYHVIISGYCREGKLDCALTLFNGLVGSGFVPTVHFYTVLISSLCKEHRLPEAERLYLEMLGNGIAPDHVLFLILVSGFPKGLELQMAVTILEAIAGRGVTSLPSHLTPSSSLPEAVSELECEIEILVEEIVQKRKCPPTVAYGILTSAFAAKGDAEKAVVCLDRVHRLGLTPLVSSYNSVIKCLCRHGDAEGADFLMGVMWDKGLAPNKATYLVMADGHCEFGDSARALGVLDMMEEAGVEPGVAIYDTVIGLLCRERRIVEAEGLFRRMLERGGFPDKPLFATMINGYSVNGKMAKARGLFEKMTEHGAESSLQAYTAVITGLVKKNMVGKGCFYLSRMLEEGFLPNTLLYTSLIQQFLRKGEVEFVFRLVDLMETYGIGQDMISYLVLVSGVCRNLVPISKNRPLCCDEAVLEERNLLLHLLQEKSFLPGVKMAEIPTRSPEDIRREAMKLVEAARCSVFMPNLYIYNSLMFGLCQVGKLEEAYGYFEELQREGLSPNHVTLTILMCGHIRRGEVDPAIELYVRMNRADRGAADRVAHNTLMSGLCRYRRLAAALVLWPGMRKRGISPNRYTCRILLDCFICDNMGIQAFRFYEEMVGEGFLPWGRSPSALFCALYLDNRQREAHTVLDTVERRGKLLENFVRLFMDVHRRKGP